MVQGQQVDAVGGVSGRKLFKVDSIAPIAYAQTTSHVGQIDSSTRTSFVGAVSQMGLYSYADQSSVGLNPFQFGTGFIGGNYQFNENGEYVPVQRGEGLSLIG